MTSMEANSPSDGSPPQPSIVGFALSHGLGAVGSRRRDRAIGRALSHFPWLQRATYQAGDSSLRVWGHGEIDDCVHRTPQGDLMAIIGSPSNQVPWADVEAEVCSPSRNLGRFILPWEGRALLLLVGGQGDRWAIWNDWVGSIPVYHARVGRGRIAASLEPAVVAAAGYTPGDFSLTGMLALLLTGHYLGTMTVFEGMETLPSDCFAQWREGRYDVRRLRTVQASDERWGSDWDALCEEMHCLAAQAISDVLATERQWVLPLSGGLDSRMIAAVGSKDGSSLRAYSYGPADYIDPLAAERVAAALHIPWQRVDIGPDYLARYTRTWCDWFGSSLHVHGMYQMPFLDHLLSEPDGPMLHGFTGDALSGISVGRMLDESDDADPATILDSVRPAFWGADELKGLVKGLPPATLEEVRDAVRRQYDDSDGAHWQRLLRCSLERQRMVWFYHPMMYDYWRGVATPYLNRAYGRFCLSLPLVALRDRSLLKDVFRRFYPDLARIPGTYGLTLEPGHYAWALRRFERVLGALARRIPASLRLGPLAEFDCTVNTTVTDALRATGEAALWPLNLGRHQLEPWFNLDVLEETYQAAANGDRRSYVKLQPIQAIALRVLEDAGES